MTKAVKCPACHLYYNGTVYSKCPHCNTAPTSAVYEAEKPKPDNDNEKLKEKGKETGLGSFFVGGRETMPFKKMEKEEKTERKSDKPEKEPANTPAPTHEIKDAPDSKEKKEPSNHPQPAGSLKEQLRRNGRTVGKFTSNNGDEAAEPVVGWLVCIKGTYFGQSFALRSGKNKIGRSAEMDIKLLSDESVSRTCVASIVYDTRAKEFSIIPGESDSLCYVNASAIYERKHMDGFEQIEFGDSEKNKFIFVPLCGDKFDWAAFQPQR